MADVPETMQAWRVRPGDSQPLVRRRITTPKAQPNELLVKILAMGVCHSDCAIRDAPRSPEARRDWAAEFTLGHEGAGEIVHIGSGVDASRFVVGDKVAIHIIPGCNQCLSCRSGLQRICRAKDNGGYGLGRDGFFQEYAAVRADAAVKVPEGVSIAEAAIAADAVLTAYHAVKYAAEVKPEQTILINGLGGLGLNALQVATHLGVKRILACDKKQEALDLAVKLGVAAEDAICTGKPDCKPVHQVVAEREIILDTVIDFVGVEETLTNALLAVRSGGLLVMVGLLSPQVPLSPLLIVSRVLNIKGSFAGTVDGLRECLDLLSHGVIRPQIETASIEELPAVMDALDDSKYLGRKVLLPTWKQD